MKFVYHDGGREAAGFRGDARDCVVRAIAIACDLQYRDVYNEINVLAATERGNATRSNSRTGVHKKTYAKLIDSLGWSWVPTMTIGSGCRVHLRSNELPAGRIIVRLSRHVAAVIDGVLYDTYDCSRNGTRCVYGYWTEGAAR